MAVTYDSIISTTLSSATAPVVFSNIPQIYTDIIAVVESYNTSAAFLQYLEIGSSSGSYGGTIMRGDGANAITSTYTNDNVVLGDSPVGMNYQNSVFGTYVYHIMNYSNTTTFKTVLTRATLASNTISGVHMKRTTSAISSVIFSCGGGSFAVGSTFSLYGIKAA